MRSLCWQVELAQGGSRGGRGGGGGGGGFGGPPPFAGGGRGSGGGFGGGVSRRTGYRVMVTGLPKSASWQDLKDHMRKAGDGTFAQVHAATFAPAGTITLGQRPIFCDHAFYPVTMLRASHRR